jgi:protein gp37
VTGCSKISAGCANCYAERMARRLQAMGQPNYARGFQVTTHEQMVDRPLAWTRPSTVFVNSMGDLFHEDVPAKFVARVFATMNAADRHTFQVLTKRSGRLLELAPGLPWPGNVWAGVSVESADYVHRIEDLRSVSAAVRFLSLEPLLGPLPGLDLTDIDWVIVGGESGPGARPIDPDWVREIRDQCLSAGVPFFFKQWGGTRKKAAGRLLDDRVWDEMPAPSSRDGVAAAG